MAKTIRVEVTAEQMQQMVAAGITSLVVVVKNKGANKRGRKVADEFEKAGRAGVKALGRAARLVIP